MRGRVTAVLILSFFLSLSSEAACNWSPRNSIQFRSTLYDVAVEGNDLWTATGYGVELYDRTSETLIDTLAIPGPTRVIRVRGGIAYVGSGPMIHVVRYNGRSLERLGGFEAGGTVHDVVVLDTYLFAATTAGIRHFAIFSPVSATPTNVALATSRLDVTSLSLDGTTLYAADGDSTIEVFNVSSPALPQKSGTIASLTRPSSVAAANGRVYASDGQMTEVYISGTRAATLPLGSTAFATLTGDIHFIAGNDRRFHALDVTLPGNPIELFEAELIPSGGTLNRALAMQVASGHLYVAAGDAGLLIYDIRDFHAPFPLRGYNIGSVQSVATLQTHAYFGHGGGGISELSINSAGALGVTRNWMTNGTHIVHDAVTGFLLTSSGKTLTEWTLVSTTPTIIWTANFPDTITAAAIVGNTAYALLADRTLWSASLAAGTPAPVKVVVPPTDEMARFGGGLVLAEETSEGTTILRLFGSMEFGTPTRTITIEGVPASGLAAGDASAAVFTFRGVTFVDFTANTVTVMPGSNNVVARRLAIAGRRVVELTDDALLVWDVATQRKIKELPLTAEGVAVAVTPDNRIAVAGLNDGALSALLEGATQPPTLATSVNPNAYFRKLAANDTRAYLLDNRGVDVLDITLATPQVLNAIRTAGLIDLTATGDRLFTLAGNGRVTAYSRDGYALGETTINDGPDTQPLAIHAAGNAVWVSISRGCLSGGCEKKTLVLDPNSLATTATLSGGVVDVVSSGTRAYALFDQPSEARVLNIADPLHPAAIATRETTGNSIAFGNGRIYILGDVLTAYTEQLQPAGTQLSPIASPDPLQRVRIDGACAIITSRTFNAATYTPTNGDWTASTAIEVPSAVKAVVVQPGRVLLLTEHSLEIWSTSEGETPARRRSSR
ncbi:MAG TPA: hypothetical protein VF618_04945 [Thermoanaerobaculia bacterium]